MRILFLYTELADYFLAGVRALRKNFGTEIRIIRWDINQDAPFRFSFPEGVEVHEKGAFPSKRELKKACIQFQPDLIYVAGWSDKDYLYLAHFFKNRVGIPVVSGLDNPWTNSFKQRLGVLLSPLTIRRCFTHFWVAGIRQYEFARRLGFLHHSVVKGLYSADVERFSQGTPSTVRSKSPRILLFVGRFIEKKGVLDLYEAFQEVTSNLEVDWQLLLVGNGALKDRLVDTRNIRVIPFVQPADLVKIMAEATAACLPSWNEPWGVVVHEFAAAGLPIIVSDEVNAGEAFVKPGYNGWIFKAKNKASLKQKLTLLFQTPDETLQKMGLRSRELSLQNTPEIWASTLINLIQSR